MKTFCIVLGKIKITQMIRMNRKFAISESDAHSLIGLGMVFFPSVHALREL